MKKLLLIVFALTSLSFGQAKAYDWTKNLQLKKFAAGTTGIADSLNWNTEKIDTGYKWNLDTINAVKADFYAQHNYSGAHQNNVITWNNLTAAMQAEIVRTSTAQAIAGNKTFTSGVAFGASAIMIAPTYANTTQGTLYRSASSGADLLFFNYGSSLRDTIASQRWVRNNLSTLASAVLTTGSQNVGGAKTFTTGIDFGASAYFGLPSTNYEYVNGLFGDQNNVYFTKAGVTGDFDTLLSWTDFQTIPIKRHLLPFTNNGYNIGSNSYRWGSGYFTNIYAGNIIYTNNIQPVGADTVVTIGGTAKRIVDTDGKTIFEIQGATRRLGNTAAPIDSLILKGGIVNTDTTNVLWISSKKVSINGIITYETESTNVTSGITLGVTRTHVELTPDDDYNIQTITDLNANKGGSMLYIVNMSASKTITLQDAVDNLQLAGDCTLAQYDSITLIYSGTASAWIELSRSDN